MDRYKDRNNRRKGNQMSKLCTMKTPKKDYVRACGAQPWPPSDHRFNLMHQELYCTAWLPSTPSGLTQKSLRPVAVAEAKAAPDTAPVPVSVKLYVSLLFWPIGWKRNKGIFDSRDALSICEEATMGPMRRAKKRTSKAKYSVAYRQTRLFLSFDCFME